MGMLRVEGCATVEDRGVLEIEECGSVEGRGVCQCRR